MKKKDKVRSITKAEKDLWLFINQKTKLLDPTKVLPEFKQVPSIKKSVDEQASIITRKYISKTIAAKSFCIRTPKSLRYWLKKHGIQKTLDMHGMKQEAARSFLERNILKGYKEGVRVFLIITGWGKSGTPGVLRESLVYWLQNEPLLGKVLFLSESKIEDGGKGAFYVVLRRDCMQQQS